jgi:sec-independent protein translocase protein TatC
MKDGETLIYTGLPEAFFTYLKVAFLTGLIVASPIILYQFWMFVAPGLYKTERRMMAPVVLLSSLFFIGGALFGYFVVFPWGFKFFLGFATDTIRPLPSMREYFGFSAKLLLAFGLVFELPIVLTFLAKLGIVSVEFLKKNRKYAILIFFAGAAILTPPDVITQIMMALPLMALYEISIIGAKLFGKKKPKEEKTETPDKSAA